MPIKPKKVVVSKKETTSKNNSKTIQKKDKIENFKWKQSSNWFAQNPQNINKNWRPKKGISAILEKIQDLGYEQPSKQDIEATYISLLNLTENELTNILGDPNTPMIAKIVAKDLVNWWAIWTIERLLDRAIGRTKEEVNINGNISTSLNEEDKKMYEKILNFKKKK